MKLIFSVIAIWCLILSENVNTQLTSYLLNLANNAVNSYQSPTLTVIDTLTGGSATQLLTGSDNNNNYRPQSGYSNSGYQSRPSTSVNRFPQVSASNSVNSVNYCRDLFTYQRGGNWGITETYGLITIPYPDLNQNNIRVIITVASRLNSNDRGELSLYKSKEESYSDVKNGRSLQLRMRFPVQSPQPKIHQIYLNNMLLCSTEKEVASYVTTITLSYIFTLLNAPVQQQYRPPPTQPPYQPPTQNYQNYETDPPTTERQTYRPYTTTQKVTYRTNPTTQPTTTKQTTTRTTYRTFPSTTPRTIKTTMGFSQFNSDGYLDEICGVPDYKKPAGVSLIKGGSRVVRRQLPWLVAYFYSFKHSNQFICGGSLVSKRLVVTAAHCIQEVESNDIKRPELSTFYLGKNNIESLVQELHYVSSIASQLIIHPNWNRGATKYENDIAIAVLIRETEFNKFVRPICLWKQTQSYHDIVGKNGLIAGWGKTDTTDISGANAIFTHIPVVGESQCLSSDSRFREILSKNSFCAGVKNSNSGPCTGDSGGGFVIEDNGKSYLRGVVSTAVRDEASNTCDNNQYAVFTDVTQYTDWIVSHMGTFS